MVLHLRNETDGVSRSRASAFSTRPTTPPHSHASLAAPFAPASSWSGMSVPLEAWRLPLRRRDPVLRHVLESHADSILSRGCPSEPAWRSRFSAR